MTIETKPTAGGSPSATNDQSDERIPVLVEVRGDFRPVHRLSEHNVLGRSAECTVWIMDPLASRRHAEINLTSAGAYELIDLDSTFGTFLNKRKSASATLTEGDEIFIGATQLRFETRAPEDVGMRRHQNRLHCEMTARVLLAGERIETRATDLSLGGLRVDWEAPVEFGTELELEIDLPGRDTPLRQRGQASHWSDDKGLGVRFLFDSEEDEQRLAEAYAQVFLASDQPED